MTEERLWHVVKADKSGTSEESDASLRQKILGGTIQPETLIWRPGMDAWQRADEIPGLFTPPQIPSLDANCQKGSSPSASAQDQPPPHEAQEMSGQHPARVAFVSKFPPLKERKGSYIARHWRGELSLGTSYWVNGFLISVGMAMVQAVLSEMDITKAPQAILWFHAVFSLFAIPIAIWQVVGIWQSAGNSIERNRTRGQSAVWAILARVGTSLGLLSLLGNTVNYTIPGVIAELKIASGHDETPPHALAVLNHGTEVKLSGGIDFGTANDLQTLLNASPGVKTVDLDSIGGRVAEARVVHDMIRSRRLATYVDALCASACTIIYMGGNPRFLGPEGKLGFHRFNFPGLRPVDESTTNSQGETELVEAGVSASFAAKAFSTASTDMWYPDRPTLLSARVVTHEVDGMSFSVAAAGASAMNMRDLEASFSNIPAYAALKRADPTSYGKAMALFESGVQQGVSVQEVMNTVKPVIFAAVGRFKPFASDDVQIRIAILTADEATMLATDHPDQCMAMLNGTGTAYGNFLSEELRQRELGVLAEVVDSGFNHPSKIADNSDTGGAELKQLWSQLLARGVDVSSVNKEQPTPAEERSACRAEAEFMRLVANLPPQRAGALMRYLLTSS